VIGDWNGDGVDTFAVYNPTTSLWLFSNNPNNAAPSTAASTTYGVSGDVPVSGDWDGDGIDTIGIFRPSTGQWHLTNLVITTMNQAPPAASIITYGAGSETGAAVNGVWIPGLKSGLGLRRGSEFSLKNASGIGGNVPVEMNAVVGADLAFDYGQVGDAPVAGRWGQITATPVVLTPTPSPTLSSNACGLQVSPNNILLLNDDLSAAFTSMPNGTILVATQGRGRLQYDPLNPGPFTAEDYRYVKVTYNGQVGWIYSIGTVVNHPPGSNNNNCRSLPLIRLDYQGPASTSPFPLTFDQNATNLATYCAAIPGINQGSGAVGSCQVYAEFQKRFFTAYGRYASMKDIFAATVQAEWWAFQSRPGQGSSTIRIDASEGQSRSYFSASNCKRGVCELPELFNYLAAYEPWRLGVAGAVIAGNNLRGHYGSACTSGFQSIACGNPLQSGQTPSVMTQTIEDIFNPSPASSTTGTNVNTNWAAGAINDRPWQWYSCSAALGNTGSGRTIGTLDTQIWNRFENVPSANRAFEIFTLRQDQNAPNPPC
jgi:hypothetical protein